LFTTDLYLHDTRRATGVVVRRDDEEEQNTTTAHFMLPIPFSPPSLVFCFF
jgi:flavin reductase (DIM6/NTAB) family NADH-FMN oxidoreductase RutF